jgi:ATP-dependent protease ClpP protease subunit
VVVLAASLQRNTDNTPAVPQMGKKPQSAVAANISYFLFHIFYKMPTTYSFKNQGANVVVQFHGFIGEGYDIKVKDFIRDFDAATAGIDNVIIEINSGGGSVVDGFSIIDQLKNRGKNITCRVVGMAASMGFVFMLVAKRIEMMPNATLMVHRVTVGTGGDADQIRDIAILCEKYEARIIAMIMERTKLDETTVKGWFKSGRDTWMTAQEALAYNLIDAIIDAPQNTAGPILSNAQNVYNFYNTILNPTTDGMTPEQLAEIGLSATATPAEITARLKAMNLETAALKNELKNRDKAAIDELTAQAVEAGIDEAEFKAIAQASLPTAKTLLANVLNITGGLEKPADNAAPVVPINQTVPKLTLAEMAAKGKVTGSNNEPQGAKRGFMWFAKMTVMLCAI